MTDAPNPQRKIAGRLKTHGLLAALAVTTVGSLEGLRQTAYPDPATRGKPWTDCYGHTGPDVRRGVRESLAQCKELLLADLAKAGGGIDRCITHPTTDGQAVAFLSLAYNIGVGGFCRSSIARDFNAGRVTQACNDLMRYDRAAGVVFPGLERRRAIERHLCLGQTEE